MRHSRIRVERKDPQADVAKYSSKFTQSPPDPSFSSTSRFRRVRGSWVLRQRSSCGWDTTRAVENKNHCCKAHFQTFWQSPPCSICWTARFRLFGQSWVLCQRGSCRWTPCLQWKRNSSPRPTPTSSIPLVGVDWAACGRRTSTQTSTVLDVYGHDWQTHGFGQRATALAVGARSKMSLGCNASWE